MKFYCRHSKACSKFIRKWDFKKKGNACACKFVHHNPLMRPDILTSIIKTNKLLSILISQPYYMLLPTWIPLPKYRLLSTSIALPEYRQASTSISLPKYGLLSTLISLPKYRLLSTWVSLSTCEKKFFK